MSISTYVVQIEALAENCNEIYHEEIFESFAEAQDRFNFLMETEVSRGHYGDDRRLSFYEVRPHYRTGISEWYSVEVYDYTGVENE